MTLFIFIYEPFPAYPPEVNSFRINFGPQAETWLTTAANFQGLSDVYTEQAAIFFTNLHTITNNLQGVAKDMLLIKGTKYHAWMLEFAGHLNMHFTRFSSLATAFETANATMPPFPYIIDLDATFGALCGTNFMGVNSGAIAENRAQWGFEWGRAAAVMVAYTAAAEPLSMLIPATPPPRIVHGEGIVPIMAEVLANLGVSAGEGAMSVMEIAAVFTTTVSVGKMDAETDDRDRKGVKQMDKDKLQTGNQLMDQVGSLMQAPASMSNAMQQGANVLNPSSANQALQQMTQMGSQMGQLTSQVGSDQNHNMYDALTGGSTHGMVEIEHMNVGPVGLRGYEPGVPVKIGGGVSRVMGVPVEPTPKVMHVVSSLTGRESSMMGGGQGRKGNKTMKVLLNELITASSGEQVLLETEEVLTQTMQELVGLDLSGLDSGEEEELEM